MVIKRPSNIPHTEAGSGPELAEHLVKKSLDINPALRRGMATHEVLEELRKEAVARSQHGATQPEAAPAQASRANLSDRRKSTVAFFLEQKAQEFDAAAGEIAVRERLLLNEKQELQKRIAQDLVDFLSLMSGGVDAPECHEILKDFRGFLTKLGSSDADLLRQAKNRR
jgi:hypothetical protein